MLWPMRKPAHGSLYKLLFKMNRTKIEGHLIIAAVSIIFGLNLVVSKLVLPDDISPGGLTLARAIFACIAFWITSLFIQKEKVAKSDLLMLFICGITGIVLNQGVFLVGLNSTSPVDASVLVTCTPMFVIVLAFFFLKEPITWKKAGGVLIGASGAIFLILSGHHIGGQHAGNVFGNLMIITSGLMYAIYLTIAKPLTLKYSSVTIMKWMFLFSTVILFPFFHNDMIESPALTAPYNPNTLWCLFFILFGATYLAYMMIPMALKRIRPTTLSMYNYIQPLIASLVATFIGQDTITWQKVVSAAFIFTGVYLVAISKSRADMEAEAAKNFVE